MKSRVFYTDKVRGIPVNLDPIPIFLVDKSRLLVSRKDGSKWRELDPDSRVDLANRGWRIEDEKPEPAPPPKKAKADEKEEG